ncbi:MAG: 50S ribosomal protein L4 [Chloroflexota bacterium]
MKIDVHNLKGEVVGDVELQDGVFDVPFREAVVHQAVVCLLANRRQGTASTKTRGEIVGSTRKLFSQKGTGRARRGSIKSPLVRGGGTVFGPSPRSYRQRLPRKMKRLAFRCALSMKAREGDVWVVEDLPAERPRTKGIVALLSSAGLPGSALIVTPEPNPVLALSARNVQGTRVRPCATLSTLDVMTTGKLITTVSALRKMEAIWGSEGSNDESA